MSVANLNEDFPLRMIASDGRTTLFGRMNIYNSDNLLLHSLAANHVAEGVYGVNWTPNIEGVYTVVGRFFLDALFTIDASYERVIEQIEVSSLKAWIARTLGLLHENVVIDNQGYDSNGNLTLARIRTYTNKADALAAGPSGILRTYEVTASYTGNLLNFYRMVPEE